MFYKYIDSAMSTQRFRGRSPSPSSVESGSISSAGNPAPTYVSSSSPPAPTGCSNPERECPPSSSPRESQSPPMSNVYEEIGVVDIPRDSVTTRVENLTSLAQTRYTVSIFVKTNSLFSPSL